MRISPSCLAVLSLLPGLVCAAAAPTEIKIGADRRIRINDDWRFFKGEADGAAQSGFQRRRLAFTRPAPRLGHRRSLRPQIQSTGRRPSLFGVAWYRKHFVLPAAAKGKYVSVQFDGAMSNSTVWINGQKLGGRPYGYDELRARSDALPQVRRGKRARRPARARGSILALVSGRRHLPERVAQRDRTRCASRNGARTSRPPPSRTPMPPYVVRTDVENKGAAGSRTSP